MHPSTRGSEWCDGRLSLNESLVHRKRDSSQLLRQRELLYPVPQTKGGWECSRRPGLQHNWTLWAINPDHTARAATMHNPSPARVVLFLQPGMGMVPLQWCNASFCVQTPWNERWRESSHLVKVPHSPTEKKLAQPLGLWDREVACRDFQLTLLL